ncbi:lysophospholipid acyltransferase family protein [Desulfopila aestuarii]|uniref:KDO2-lipid IV(A) lauroyltransferase n=1 Tax=Desulfopila aestuarii DSM 18488 TaxID=1121416 RepID=A0A1M7Y825_9BACT|nr:lysophospholipid acyltransferase family protein [Desulfopila aestuarii]SHO48770.1 KDO2-lipid IV(A) lauroyltransferase [Desulfopila aestuarii DSM 18488]
MKKIRHFIEFQFLLGLGLTTRWLSRQALLRFGARLGDIIYYCFPVRKNVTVTHLTSAFPEKSPSEISYIARGAYRNLGMNTLEHLALPNLTRDALLDLVVFENLDVLKEAQARGKGTVLVGGHFGNWEYPSCALGAAGYRLGAVVAEISNKYLDKEINDHRRMTGLEVIPKGTATRGIVRLLRNNGIVGMLMDQNAGSRGVFVNYFGRLCSAPKGPASIALKMGAAMVFGASIRQPDGTIRVVFEPVIIDYEAGATEDNIRDITQRCTNRLEHYARLQPDQWFWMHRRWKSRPPGENEVARQMSS